MFVPDQPSRECIWEGRDVYAAVHNSVQRGSGADGYETQGKMAICI